MQYIDYSLMQFCGMHGWVAKQSIHPFEFDKIYFDPLCIAILPISDNLSSGNYNYNYINNIEIKEIKEIKNLYYKMLTVLDLRSDQLLTAFMQYNNIQNDIQKNLLTKKLLYYRPKCILTFGDPDFIDLGLLDLQKIIILSTFHPEHLLKNLSDKLQAYQDLLLCKKKLASIS